MIVRYFADGFCMRFSRGRTLLVSLLIITWLVGSLGALWWFQSRLLRPFVTADAAPEFRDLTAVSDGLSAILQTVPAVPGAVTMVHLWNPDCSCNSVSQRHVDATLDQFGENQLHFVILAPVTASEEDMKEMKELNPRATLIRLRPEDQIPLSASPGLAMYTPQQKLAYFGAYGFGALCTPSDSNLFVNMVNALLAGESYGPFMNIAGSGCFCAWPQHPAQSPQ
ncbi:MAG: hypothetical protein CMI00_16255 [Oceanospirillaceae bacterium]|nr:hypothetical protein [Oceanospirillaceae bacterium]